jgi:hypothetical protein
MAGLDPNLDAIETFVQESVVAMRVRQVSDSRDSARLKWFESRLVCALAQKRILAHIIDIYHSKYQLNIFSRSEARPSVIVKFRRIANVVLACIRARRSIEKMDPACLDIRMRVDVLRSYAIPRQVNVVKRGPVAIEPSSAVLALSALPRLQRALADREQETRRLQLSIASLESCKALDNAGLKECERCASLCDAAAQASVELDSTRKELSLLLEKAKTQCEEVSVKLSGEREARAAAEDKIAKCLRKALSYRTRLKKTKEKAAKDSCAYRSAIHSLTNMAREATDADKVNRSSIDTIALIAEANARISQTCS